MDTITTTPEFKKDIADLIKILINVAKESETDEKTLAYYDRVREKVDEAINNIMQAEKPAE